MPPKRGKRQDLTSTPAPEEVHRLLDARCAFSLGITGDDRRAGHVADVAAREVTCSRRGRQLAAPVWEVGPTGRPSPLDLVELDRTWRPM